MILVLVLFSAVCLINLLCMVVLTRFLGFFFVLISDVSVLFDNVPVASRSSEVFFLQAKLIVAEYGVAYADQQGSSEVPLLTAAVCGTTAADRCSTIADHCSLQQYRC